jgi:nucleotide sugar dehydrogenase
MVKYASNAFLATKISFINEIASICEKVGADVTQVARGMGLDARIGAAFLNAGVGYGGSCFPKDVQALAHMAALSGCHPQLLRAVMEINRDARRSVVLKLRTALGSSRRRRSPSWGWRSSRTPMTFARRSPSKSSTCSRAKGRRSGRTTRPRWRRRRTCCPG